MKGFLIGMLHSLFGVIIPFWLGVAVLDIDIYSVDYFGLFALLFGCNIAGYVHGKYDARPRQSRR